MDKISEGLKFACNVAKAAPAWLDNMLTTLDKFNLLPVWEWRKQIALDKLALQIKLDEQKAEHDSRMLVLNANTKQRIAHIETQGPYSLKAIGEQIASGTPPSVAFTADPFAIRATTQLYADTLDGQYAKERIALYAALEAAEHPDRPIAEGETSETFFANFWDYAKNIRDEDAMQVWGKLLAGEIQQPGKFSVRTLDMLRSLSTKEAQLFKQLSSFVVSGEAVFFEFSEEEGFLDIVSYKALELLGIAMGELSFPLEKPLRLEFKYFSAILASSGASTQKDIQSIFLTPCGRELYSLVDITYEQSEKLFTLVKVKAEQQGMTLTKIS